MPVLRRVPGLGCSVWFVPTACAVGYFLSPFRAWLGANLGWMV
jgi:hypothetical protein